MTEKTRWTQNVLAKPHFTSIPRLRVCLLLVVGLALLCLPSVIAEQPSMILGASYSGLLTEDSEGTLFANYEPGVGLKLGVFPTSFFGLVVGGDIQSNIGNSSSYFINGERQDRFTYAVKGGIILRLGGLSLYPLVGFGMGSPINKYTGDYLYLGGGIDILLIRSETGGTGIYFEYGHCSGTYEKNENVFFGDDPQTIELTSTSLNLGVSYYF